MKKLLLVFTSTLVLCSFYGCEKTVTEQFELLCDNSIKDGRETEIDCGGVCSPCPAPSTFSATLTGGPTVGGVQRLNTSGSYGHILGPSIRVAGTNVGDPLKFMFIPGPIGEPCWISSVSFGYNGEPYTKDDDVQGFAYVTAHDTLRKIISGTFSFGAERITKGIDKCVVTEGVFTNVRYYSLD